MLPHCCERCCRHVDAPKTDALGSRHPRECAPGRPVNISFEIVPSGEDNFIIKRRIIIGAGPGGLVLTARSLVSLCGAEKLRFRSLRFIAVGR